MPAQSLQSDGRLVMGALVLLVTAAVCIDHQLSGQLMQEFDDGLLAKARIIAGLVEREGTSSKLEFVTGSCTSSNPGNHSNTTN